MVVGGSRLDLESFRRAIEAFKIAFDIYDCNTLPDFMPEKIVLRDGVIQRFEFTFELSWKTLKRYLEEYGLEQVDTMTNRELFRVGFEQGLLDNPEVWFHYLKMRNQSSHLYNETKAAIVFSAARNFLHDVQSLFQRLEVKIND
mgnify:CR=1 FL=1